jgi:hypothetical protein
MIQPRRSDIKHLPFVEVKTILLVYLSRLVEVQNLGQFNVNGWDIQGTKIPCLEVAEITPSL